MNYINGKDRSQLELQCLEDFISDESEIRLIDKLVDSFDMKELGFNIGNNSEGGRPTFNPKDIMKLYIYGYLNGIRSSRKLAKQCKINLEIKWLLRGLCPEYRVISNFRRNNIDSFQNIFTHFTNLCLDLGLYGKELIAVDGTKVEASASKRKHYSKNKIQVMKKRVQENIDKYINDLNENDDHESGENIETLIQKQEEKLSFYSDIEKILDEENLSEINLTDLDARTMKFGSHQGTDVGYNIQSVVDSKHNLIVTYDVSNKSCDQGQLCHMSSKAQKVLKNKSLEVLADKGYYDVKDIDNCVNLGLKPYVRRPSFTNSTGNSKYYLDKFIYNKNGDYYTCPEGKVLYCKTKKQDVKTKVYYNYETCASCKNKDLCTKSKHGRIISRDALQSAADAANERTKNNPDKYSKRQCMVEHPFGTLKTTMNFYYLLTRNLKNVRGEISIALFAYNLKRVMNILDYKKFNDAMTSLIISYFKIHVQKIIFSIKPSVRISKIAFSHLFFTNLCPICRGS